MEDIPVFICYGGRWDEKNNYVGYKVKGILIQENITYLKLLEILYAELALSPTEYSFSVKFDTKIPKAPPMDLDNDSDIRFFLRLKKGDKENNKYPLFVSINRQPTRSLEGTNQVFTMNPVLPSLPHMETDAKAPNDDNPSGSESLGKGGAYSITPEMGAIGLDGEPYFEKDHIAFNSPTAPPVETFQYGTNAVYMEQICNFNKTKNTVVGDQEALKRKKESARGFLTDFNVDDIKVNYLFKDKEFLKKCLSFIAMRNNFQYRVAKSDRKLVSLKCLNNDCKWTVRARRYKNTNMFRIVKYVQDHNCSLEPIVGDHKQASASLIGQCIKLKCLETGREYTPNDIMRDMQQKYGVTISYEKAWRARKMALDDLTGAPEDSYTHLPSFCYMLESKNPGTVTNIETDDHNRFKYLFVSFGASIRGWQYCRSVIVVDRTLLRVRNGRVLFMACAKDGNNEIFPLGFGIGDSENDASWEWFFRMLKEAIGDRDDLAIISDLNNSISSAVATVYPNAYHGLCMQHLKHTLKAKFKKIFLDDLFCSAAKAYRVCDFNYFMLEMEKLEPSIPTYIRELDPEKWACAFFPRCRYNIMTTDIADSLKAILEKAREYPVATLMEQLCCMIQRWFWDRKNIDAATLSPVTSWAENELKQKIFDSHSILVCIKLHLMFLDKISPTPFVLWKFQNVL
ncbi:hypothetical protein UlMin_010684 [Ulmus minor]